MVTLATKIKIELLKRGISGAAIARQEGVVRQAIYHVVAGRRRSPRLRGAIARAIGTRVEKLWPEQGRKDKAA